MADFLFEIGLEEVPARMIAGAQAELQRRIVALLERERLAGSEAASRSFSTPRRLAVVVEGVLEKQQDVTEEVMGPAAKIAYKDGQPGPAAVAFAKKCGVEVAELKLVSTAKGDYLGATTLKRGRPASDVIAAELPKELAAIPWAKNMYWRTGKPERFVRPVRWMVALLGNEVVPVSFGGYVAGRTSYGHRVLHGAGSIAVNAPETYLEQLRQAFVMADVENRRHTIRKALDVACRTIPETRWREDHVLVDKMTHLTEWPSVIAGSFEAEFLALPEEVLVTVMRDHQNYFAVEDKQGKLAPKFLAVLNTAADATGEAVIRHGNERVLRARFNDARFFWEFDQRIHLEERVALLKDVTFQKDLGSYALKSERVSEVARRLAALLQGRGVSVDDQALATAARLAKTDLTTELVKEFTELQGQVGGLYAQVQGMSAKAADAIYDHYRPVSMEDRIPGTVEGQVLAIADKADTIAGMFGVGMEPTGSKDPFALRRAANGIVKILAEGDLPLELSEVVAATRAVDAVAHKMAGFLVERLEFYLREARGQAYDVVKSVLAVGSDGVGDAVARAEAVSAVRGSDDFAAVSAAFKRMKNILAQAAEKGIEAGREVDVSLFRHGSEERLWTESARLAPEVRRMRQDRQYVGALEATATIRPSVDEYFNGVMVMDQDEAVRASRLALLKQVLEGFGGIADFSEIVVNG